MFVFPVNDPAQMKKLFAEYGFYNQKGDFIVPPSEEIERVINDGYKRNVAALRELNPAYDYMRVYKAGTWDFPRDVNGNIVKRKESGDWKVVMTARMNQSKRIIESSPENMKMRFN